MLKVSQNQPPKTKSHLFNKWTLTFQLHNYCIFTKNLHSQLNASATFYAMILIVCWPFEENKIDFKSLTINYCQMA